MHPPPLPNLEHLLASLLRLAPVARHLAHPTVNRCGCGRMRHSQFHPSLKF